jgi:hypothetical protein
MDTSVSYEGLFNKCYATIAMAGNGGANGDCDIDGIDGGTSGYIRQMWNANELPTDEAINGWGDDGIEQSCFNTYDESHPMLNGYFSRLTTSITYCNQYLTEASDYNAQMTAEVRFLRCLHYYLLMDAFGRVPFAETLGDPVIYSRQEIFDWLVKELTENVEPNLAEPKPKKSSDAGYGRVDKAAAWILLSRLYLNAEVYTGAAKWSEAATWAKKVMDSAYQLNTTSVGGWSAYQMLFMGDNGETNAAYEGIFPILQDGIRTTSWGTTQFLCAGSFDSDMHANPNNLSSTNGVSGQVWGGNRARPNLIEKFFPKGDIPMSTEEAPNGATESDIIALDAQDGSDTKGILKAAGDDRALFYAGRGGGIRKLRTDKLNNFLDGISIVKWQNIRVDGGTCSDPQFPDTDIPLFRLAEAYMTRAEAKWRSGDATGINDVNTLRTRANAAPLTQLTEQDLIDEWCREFYMEGRRRSDLIRFDMFTGKKYNWAWKGGVADGQAVDSHFKFYPIPMDDINNNKNMTQNAGY